MYCARQLLSNGSLYVESHAAEEGVYQCQLSVSSVGVLLSRKAYVTIACKLVMHLSYGFVLFCFFCASAHRYMFQRLCFQVVHL